MNAIQGIVLSLAIILKWDNFCVCKEYQLKVVQNTNTKLETSVDNVAMWNLLSKIFQYEGFVTVITEAFVKKDSTWRDSFIRLLQTYVGLPVTVIESSDRLGKKTPATHELNHYGINSNTSYILMMDDVSVLPHFLEGAKSSSITWNSRAYFVIISYDESLYAIHEILSKMWTIHGIHKVTAIDILSGHVVVHDILTDVFKLFNVTDVDKILESPRHGLKGYPMRVTILHNPPMSVAIPNSTRFHGMDQFVLDTLESHMNFTIVMRKPTVRGKFRDDYNSLSLNEIVSQIVNRDIDLIANPMFITGYNRTGFEFTTPFFTEKIHILVPKAGRIPLWLSMYQIFDNDVWIPTALLFAICVLSWLCILTFHLNSRLRCNVIPVIIDVSFLLTGQPVSLRSNKFSEKLLVICGSIFAIIMVNCFTGLLFRRFSEVVYYPEIDDLEALKKSGLTLVHGSHGVITALNGTADPLLKSLLNGMNHSNDISTAFQTKNGVLDHAVLSRLTQINYERANSVIKNNGTQLLHKMEKSLGTFSMGYIVPKGSIFLKKLNSHINAILEAGFFQKWYCDVIFYTESRVQRLRFVSSENCPRAFTLSDLTLAWYTLALGLLTSCATFLIEIFHKNLVKAVSRLKYFSLI